MILKDKKQEQIQNNILSVSRNLEKPKLDIKLSTNTQIQNTALKLKKKIDVYENDSRLYISRAAAYALGFINTRAIMINESNQLFAITRDQMQKIRDNDYEINLIRYEIPEQSKQGILVFVSEDKMYISVSSAYSIGLIDVETFSSTSHNLYEINENTFNYINNNFRVEYEDSQKKSGYKR